MEELWSRHGKEQDGAKVHAPLCKSHTVINVPGCVQLAKSLPDKQFNIMLVFQNPAHPEPMQEPGVDAVASLALQARRQPVVGHVRRAHHRAPLILTLLAELLAAKTLCFHAVGASQVPRQHVDALEHAQRKLPCHATVADLHISNAYCIQHTAAKPLLRLSTRRYSSHPWSPF